MSYEVTRDMALGNALLAIMRVGGVQRSDSVRAYAAVAEAWLAVADRLDRGPYRFAVAPCVCEHVDAPDPLNPHATMRGRLNPSCPAHQPAPTL